MQTFAATLRQQLLVVQVVLELFSGAGGFSKAAANLGELVISIDIQFGVDTNDLSQRPLQLLVCGWIQAGYVKCVLAGFSCGSFSRARNIPGGPPALRNQEFVKGLPDLRPSDARKVEHGNRLVYFIVRLARACIACWVPCMLENPWTSWAWRMPGLESVRKCRCVRLTRKDFCQFGTPWRKATGILSTFCRPHTFQRICSGQKKCGRSRRPHQVLKGCNAQGVFWTHVAEPYPRGLCGLLVKTLCNAILELQASQLDNLFCKQC